MIQRIHLPTSHNGKLTYRPGDNARRNHDEIRFWSACVAGDGRGAYLYDRKSPGLEWNLPPAQVTCRAVQGSFLYLFSRLHSQRVKLQAAGQAAYRQREGEPAWSDRSP